MRSLIYHALVYFLAPGIMLTMLVAGVVLALKVPQRFRTPAVAGLCAGLVCFVIYVVSSSKNFQAPTVTVTTLPGFHWLPTILGLLLGFGILRLLEALELNSGLFGLLILILIVSSSVAVYSYFFPSPWRDFSILFALSAAVGMLFHIMLFPGRIRGIMKGTIQTDRVPPQVIQANQRIQQ